MALGSGSGPAPRRRRRPRLRRQGLAGTRQEAITSGKGRYGMGKMITLKAKDGFELAAYRAEPAGTPKAGLVVAQEIFGLNHHIRNVADRFAAEGYLVI